MTSFQRVLSHNGSASLPSMKALQDFLIAFLGIGFISDQLQLLPLCRFPLSIIFNKKEKKNRQLICELDVYNHSVAIIRTLLWLQIRICLHSKFSLVTTHFKWYRMFLKMVFHINMKNKCMNKWRWPRRKMKIWCKYITSVVRILAWKWFSNHDF